MPADAEFVEGLAAALRARGAAISELPEEPVSNPFSLSFAHEGTLHRALIHVRRLTPQRGMGTDHHRGADEWHAQMIFDESRRGRGVRNQLTRRRGYQTLLLGYSTVDSALIVTAWDAKRRSEYGYSRSLQVKESTLTQAAQFGVGQQHSRGHEIVVAFRAEFFPEYVDGTGDLHGFVDPSGEPETEADIPPDFFGPRDRRPVSGTRAVRDVRFKNFIARHYAGCAICGLDSAALLQAAHVIAVADSRSSDHPSNGIRLCRNCHALFDSGLLLIRPDFTIEISPRLKTLGRKAGEAYRAFAGQRLRVPRLRVEFLPSAEKLSITYELRRHER